MTLRSSVRRFGTTVVAGGIALVLAAGPAAAKTPVEVLLTGLSSPKGLTLSATGDPVVAQGAFGAPGPVLVYLLRGPAAGQAIPITEPLQVMDIAHVRSESGYLLGSDQVLYWRADDGSVTPVRDIAAYQATDPDPMDQEGNPTETNPYGLASYRGDALVADAAGNDLLRVKPDGSVTTVARFAPELVATDHLPFPAPPQINAESVPTGVTVGPDGWVYVGELKGFPFRPGSSRIWRINPNANGAICSAGGSSGGCSLYKSGFTAIQDIAFDARGRSGQRALYVYELAADGVLAFEEGFGSGNFPPAVLIKVKHGRRTELAAGKLSQPGGVSVGRNGRVFVTDGIFGNGRLVQVHG